MAQTRREFLRNTACGTLAATAMVRGLDKLFLVNAFAKPADFTDYKALVCVFLFGGNDSNNIVIPYTDYAQYDAIRGQGVNLAIAQSNLLQISPPSAGRDFGLHPALGPAGSGLHGLWGQGKVAILVNAGTLIQPISRDDYQRGIGRPYQLFSHSDQVTAYQTSYGQGHASSGWAGRLADRIQGSQTFPVVTSINGVQMFSAGVYTKPLIIGTGRLDQALTVTRNYPEIGQLVQIEQADGTRTIVQNSANLVFNALDTMRQLRDIGDPTLTTPFPNTGFANQLKQVAKIIKIATPQPPGGLGLQRQVFFVAIGGFDTHNNQGPETGQQATLWTQVSQAMTAFYNCVDAELGLASKVTTFTMSDFSRTLKPNDPGDRVGTDHAWGGHHFVMGGAVNGGDFYGTFPRFTLGADDDVDNGGGARGRFLPTTSVDQYAATMALWYGLDPADLPIVFPNLSRFSQADLGFMMQGTAPVASAERKGLIRRALGF